MRSIRRHLDLSQSKLAQIAGVTQGTVSRWENGSLEPSRQELSLIRAYAIEDGREWDDSMFFGTCDPEHVARVGGRCE